MFVSLNFVISFRNDEKIKNFSAASVDIFIIVCDINAYAVWMFYVINTMAFLVAVINNIRHHTISKWKMQCTKPQVWTMVSRAWARAHVWTKMHLSVSTHTHTHIPGGIVLTHLMFTSIDQAHTQSLLPINMARAQWKKVKLPFRILPFNRTFFRSLFSKHAIFFHFARAGLNCTLAVKPKWKKNQSA